MKSRSQARPRTSSRRFLVLFVLGASLFAINSYLLLTGGSDYLLSAIARYGVQNAARGSGVLCLLSFLLLPSLFWLPVKKGSVASFIMAWNVLVSVAFLSLAPVRDWTEVKGGLVANSLFGDGSKAEAKLPLRSTERASGEAVGREVQQAETESAPVEILSVPGEKWTLSREDQDRIAELEEYRKARFEGQFERFHKVDYAKAWVQMADTLTDPKEIVSALRLAGALHSSNPKNNLAPISTKYLEVVDRHLQSKDPRVVDAALGAALSLVMKPSAHQKTAELIMDIAESFPDPEVRAKALDTLWTYPLRPERFLKLVLTFLDPSKDADSLWVGLRVVSIQYDVNTPFPKEVHDEVVRRTWKLMDHEDPKVSTIALSAQENIFGGAGGDEFDSVGKRLIQKLKDPRPAVRTRAAQALAKLDYEPAVHPLTLLLSDDTENCYGEGGLKDYTSRQRRVNDSALASIDDLTRDLGSLHFAYSIREKKYDPALQGEVAKEALRAMSWYEENKASLPQAR